MVITQSGLVVVDEVTTGVGRTGTWYGFDHYEIEPDVVAMGKGLGNGYPVSAVAMTSRVATDLLEGGYRYAQSHQNDPMGCAVACEVVATIQQENLIARSDELGAKFLSELERLAESSGLVKEVRGRGLMIAVELRARAGSSPAATVYQRLLEQSFLVGLKPEANLLRFYPPLIISEGEIARLIAGLKGILEVLA
jgi:acetylornithine aminotransferase